eukprot:XP_001702315.1 hypoxanthine-guanine phosphoribosyltransferase [Chlamydomonas reinhardtii]
MELSHVRGNLSRTGLLQARRGAQPRRLVPPARSLSQPVPPTSQPPHSRPHPHPRPLPLHPEISKVIFSAEQIDARVAELGRLIGTDYSDRELLVLGVLKGAFAFTSDLVRHIYPYPPHLEVDFFKVGGWGGCKWGSATAELPYLPEPALAHKHMTLHVEDIIDTGNTLSALVAVMEGAGAASVRVCALLDKKARRRVPMEAEYTGFECPDEFIVGYGIDYAEKYRNLPYIGAVKDEFIKK